MKSFAVILLTSLAASSLAFPNQQSVAGNNINAPGFQQGTVAQNNNGQTVQGQNTNANGFQQGTVAQRNDGQTVQGQNTNAPGFQQGTVAQNNNGQTVQGQNTNANGFQQNAVTQINDGQAVIGSNTNAPGFQQTSVIQINDGQVVVGTNVNAAWFQQTFAQQISAMQGAFGAAIKSGLTPAVAEEWRRHITLFLQQLAINAQAVAAQGKATGGCRGSVKPLQVLQYQANVNKLFETACAANVFSTAQLAEYQAFLNQSVQAVAACL